MGQAAKASRKSHSSLLAAISCYSSQIASGCFSTSEGNCRCIRVVHCEPSSHDKPNSHCRTLDNRSSSVGAKQLPLRNVWSHMPTFSATHLCPVPARRASQRQGPASVSPAPAAAAGASEARTLLGLQLNRSPQLCCGERGEAAVIMGY
eukprot:337641-Pleurochrysis_carterae.AAC.4